MAFEVTELWSQKDVSEEQLSVGATRYYSVTGTTQELFDDRQVLNAPGIPAKGASHPGWRDLRVVNKTAGPGLVERVVSVRYAWQPGGGTQTQPDDPLQQSPEITWSIAQRTDARSWDIHGNPVANSAGDVFSDLPSVTEFSLVLDITRWEQRFDPFKTRKFVNKVNSQPLIAGDVTFLPHTMLCTGIAPADTFRAGASQIKMRYSFEIRPTGDDVQGAQGLPAEVRLGPFKWWTIDAGSRSFNGTSEPVELFRANNKGQHVGIDVRLDGTGKPLQPSEFAVYTADTTTTTPKSNPKPVPPGVSVVKASNCVFLGFDMIGEADFRELGL